MPLRLALTLIFALAFGAPLRAADVDPAIATEATADLWSGPWVGVLGAVGEIGGSGLLGGIAFGHALQFDKVVIGLEGEASGGGIDARRLGGRYELEAFGAIRARVGYAFGRFVAFGSAGVAFASAEFARSGARDREVQAGWMLGAGVDVALTDNLSARAEYVHVDLDEKTFSAGGGASLGPSGGLARLGLNYRF